MNTLMGSFQQMMQLAQSLIIMQDVIVTLYKIEKDENRYQKLDEVAERILESQNKLIQQLNESME